MEMSVNNSRPFPDRGTRRTVSGRPHPQMNPSSSCRTPERVEQCHLFHLQNDAGDSHIHNTSHDNRTSGLRASASGGETRNLIIWVDGTEGGLPSSSLCCPGRCRPADSVEAFGRSGIPGDSTGRHRRVRQSLEEEAGLWKWLQVKARDCKQKSYRAPLSPEVRLALSLKLEGILQPHTTRRCFSLDSCSLCARLFVRVLNRELY